MNYVIDFFHYINIIYKPLHQRLKKDPPPWTSAHTDIVKKIKHNIKEIPYLHFVDPSAFKIVETNASEIGYGGILKQSRDNKQQVVQFVSKHWNDCQKNYSTIKKEIIAIVLSISKFEEDLLNQFFFIKN